MASPSSYIIIILLNLSCRKKSFAKIDTLSVILCVENGFPAKIFHRILLTSQPYNTKKGYFDKSSKILVNSELFSDDDLIYVIVTRIEPVA